MLGKGRSRGSRRGGRSRGSRRGGRSRGQLSCSGIISGSSHAKSALSFVGNSHSWNHKLMRPCLGFSPLPCHAPLFSSCLCAFVNGLILNFLSSNLGELDFSALFPRLLGGFFMGNFWLLFNKKRSAFYLFLGLRFFLFFFTFLLRHLTDTTLPWRPHPLPLQTAKCSQKFCAR